MVKDIRQVVDEAKLPEGYFISIGGQFNAQEKAGKLIAVLSLGALAMIFALLYSKYQSVRLSALIMANIPLAMVGGIAALWLFGQPLSIASMVGFVALAGISISEWHSQSQPLPEPDVDRGRIVYRKDGRSWIDGASVTRHDDRISHGIRFVTLTLRSQSAWHGNPAPGSRGYFLWID